LIRCTKDIPPSTVAKTSPALYDISRPPDLRLVNESIKASFTMLPIRFLSRRIGLERIAMSPESRAVPMALNTTSTVIRIIIGPCWRRFSSFGR
jgi:hypothetical protein